MDEDEIGSFWLTASAHSGLTHMPGYFGPSTLEVVRPPAWSFGGTPEQADELLALVLAGTKTATSSALRDYEAEDEPLPTEGSLSIVLDGQGHPRALISTTDVRVVPFDEVDEEFARAEGEGDLSLAHWRRVHEEFFAVHGSTDEPVTGDMPVVLERFRVLHTRR